MAATAFIADPAGDAYIQVQIEVAEQAALVAGETMHHGRRQLVAELTQDGQQALAGVAFVEKHRQLQFDGQGQLLLEGMFLLRSWREVAVEVQAAFAHRAYPRLTQQGLELAVAVMVPAAGIVGVDAGGAEQAQARINSGALSVDFAYRRVTLDGAEVALTRKEYDVLALLARHLGRVVTQQQLLKDIWGPSHAEDSHYLRVVVGHLRQKLNDDPAAPRFIVTEAGVGYRLLEL